MTELTKVKNTNKSSLAKRSIQKMLSNKLAMIGLIVVILFALMSIFAPFITKHDPNSIDMSILNQPPGNGHLFGTDSTGRDLFSRLLYGGRMSIMIGTVSALTTSIIGTILGLITGYFRGWVDKIFVRLSEVFQAFPMTILVMVLVTTIGPSVTNMILVFTVIGWMTVFRIVRNEVLRLREETYVEVNKAFGIKDFPIMFKQILPNTMSPIIVATTINVAFFILEETGLSFLGLGVPTNVPTWGTIINAAKSILVIQEYWWQWIIPGAVISIFVMSVNFLGDGLRDVLDPKN
ncbi:ABC transporter permease [Microaceticoccus formicicus]|uniref:ABC transporter permease n=1 Tax=Microaceticoccus formicicus TaxID=3118105 RepID=UPI003CD03475|nr:ABC transporter permease [Peptoniphilaceae bacterium AMB_02]